MIRYGRVSRLLLIGFLPYTGIMHTLRPIIRLLKADGIGILATDTLYGIVGRAASRRAVERIYRLKGRDTAKPFIILISSLNDLDAFGIELEVWQRDVLNGAWPGPTSAILPCPHKRFSYLHRGTKSLAFRLIGKRQRRLYSLLRTAGPLVAPSANPQAESPAHTLSEAKAYFGRLADFYLDSGRRVGNPSRIISLLDSNVRIIR